MATEPTEAAMRAAEAAEKWADTPGVGTVADLARIIDDATGLPALAADNARLKDALEKLVQQADGAVLAKGGQQG